MAPLGQRRRLEASGAKRVSAGHHGGVESVQMLTLQPKFDLHTDVVSEVLRKEALVCRVEGEAFRCPAAAPTRDTCQCVAYEVKSGQSIVTRLARIHWLCVTTSGKKRITENYSFQPNRNLETLQSTCPERCQTLSTRWRHLLFTFVKRLERSRLQFVIVNLGRW